MPKQDAQRAAGSAALVCWADDFSDYDGDDEDNRCERCCGEGLVEYNDAPDTWGEDCPSEVNHLVRCPDCRGTGEQRRPNKPHETEAAPGRR